MNFTPDSGIPFPAQLYLSARKKIGVNAVLIESS